MCIVNIFIIFCIIYLLNVIVLILWNHFNVIKIALMLSQPMPVFVSFANNIVKISYIIFCGALFILYWLRNKFKKPKVLSTNLYQIPSQPITIN